MKTIIILMLALICQFANGQMDQKIESYMDTARYGVSGKGFEGLEFTYKQYIEAKVLKLLLSEYDKYSKECYADSTLLKHQHFMPEGERYCIVDWECLNPDHYRDYYIHTIPTFSGFMEWLKTQTK